MSTEGDLEAIAQVMADKVEADQRLHQAVAKARANGRSWGSIAIILRTSRQAARERFGP